MNMKLLIQYAKYYVQIALNSFGWQVSRYHKLQTEDIYQIEKRLLGNISDGVIFDVGAWVGNTAQSYLNVFSESKVYAFEPFPESFSKLNERFKGVGNISVEQVALSSEVGIATFYSNSIETTNSLLESAKTLTSDDFFRDTKDKIEVKTTTLDAYCLENDIKKIDLLKLDVQGGELKVLEGAKKLLESKSISLIFCEVEFIEHYKDQPLCHNIVSFLSDYGYRFYNFSGAVTNEYGELSWADALFYSEDLVGVVKGQLSSEISA
jgi:FkbM family methyltransferase